ncbi:substrate-binding domain-containing protein [Hujiaoplasma nucleasis]|uniref:Substrate-binding domain-containing protein n=1 Tax=Hujiaoplasma nucleasis TaxID=2725268 RepID=A0A7L6MZZ6_9MOLU|nr:substrate-binding domain-containing protein [Hujiaoplasma nucleasis]QLY39553.1 substrate-binding domain-containing protein [Hujiaoplasma nucleasis]
MKKVLMMFLALFAMVGLVACGGDDDQKVLAVIMPNATHGFTGESVKHATAAAERLATEAGYDYRVYTSGDVTAQAQQIETAIAEEVDVIVLWPHNGDELKQTAQSILDANIPLIVYDRLITNFDEDAELMGDNETIGEETGLYFNDYFATELAAGQVNILEFKGDNSTVPTQRSDGFWSTANDNFNLVQDWSTGWSKSTAQTQMETFLNSSEQATIESIKAVFTHDAEVAAGVLQAIEGYQGSATINIELVSAVSASRELLGMFDHYENLGIDQVTFSFSPAMVVEAIELAVDILDGEDVSGLYLVETEMVDNGNYETFMEGPVYTLRYSLEEEE